MKPPQLPKTSTIITVNIGGMGGTIRPILPIPMNKETGLRRWLNGQSDDLDNKVFWYGMFLVYGVGGAIANTLFWLSIIHPWS